MAEVGLVLFARTALEVMREVLPAYGNKYSKHTFKQPQLYCQRAQVESFISVVKRKLSAKALGRTTETQRTQAMLLGLAHNIYLL